MTVWRNCCRVATPYSLFWGVGKGAGHLKLFLSAHSPKSPRAIVKKNGIFPKSRHSNKNDQGKIIITIQTHICVRIVRPHRWPIRDVIVKLARPDKFFPTHVKWLGIGFCLVEDPFAGLVIRVLPPSGSPRTAPLYIFFLLSVANLLYLHVFKRRRMSKSRWELDLNHFLLFPSNKNMVPAKGVDWDFPWLINR